MSFKPYDILSSLIPGFLLLLALLNFMSLDYNKDFVVAYTAIAFLIGFMMNTLSSWLEDFYYFTWGGKPSSNLIEGKNIWKVKFYEHEAVKKLLTEESQKENPTSDHLFAIAMRYANGQKDSRVDDFNANYAFARVILTTMFLATIILLIKNFTDWRYYVILIPILIVIWLRCKQRGYYYAREVLNEYMKKQK
jgi:hypothetical protein